jgi:hypothetical protein
MPINKPYTAIANLSITGYPASSMLPGEEGSFETIEQAIDFLKQRGGGAISTWASGDFRLCGEVLSQDDVRIYPAYSPAIEIT